MKPAAFAYHRPESVDEALALLARHAAAARVLAGGQSLMPLLNRRALRPDHLIDINGLDALAGLRADDDGLQIGALVRQAALERADVAATGWPILREAVSHVAHEPIRNRGTIGGSAAHADPSAELPTVLAALDASLTARSQRGQRTLAWEDFFVGPQRSALAPDEMLVSISVPPLPAGTGWAFLEVARRPQDPALAGAAVLVTIDAGQRCRRAAIALLGAGPTPIRAREAEAQIAGAEIDTDVAAETARAAVANLGPLTDGAAEAAYRRGALETLVARALSMAVTRSSSRRL